MKRNVSIDILKALFSIVIFCFHVKNYTSLIVCKSGHFAVDYYLIAAGSYLFLKAEKIEALMAPHQYFVERFKRFFVVNAVAFCLACIIELIVSGFQFTLGNLITSVTNNIWEVLMIHWTGIGNCLNGPAWTISALLLVGTIIWGCIYCNKKVFVNLGIPLCLILGFGFWSHLDETFYNTWLGCVYYSVFRAFMDMLLGYYCVKIAEYIKKKNLNKRERWLLSLFDVLLIILAIGIMFKKEGKRYQFFCILVFVFSISVSLSGTHVIDEIVGKYSKLITRCAEMGLSLYLVHAPLIRICSYYNVSWNSKKGLLLFATITAGITVIHWTISKTITERMKKRYQVQADG